VAGKTKTGLLQEQVDGSMAQIMYRFLMIICVDGFSIVMVLVEAGEEARCYDLWCFYIMRARGILSLGIFCHWVTGAGSPTALAPIVLQLSSHESQTAGKPIATRIYHVEETGHFL